MNKVVLTFGKFASKEICVCINKPVEDLLDFYKKGCDILGFDFEEEMYDTTVIRGEKLHVLYKHDLLKNWVIDKETSKEDIDIRYDDDSTYPEIWLEIAKLGEPILDFLIEDSNFLPKLNIGGSEFN